MEVLKQYILSVVSDDCPGLLSRILNMLNRRCIEIESVGAARTDIRDIVCITVEMNIEPSRIINLVNQVKKIVEVVQIEAKLLMELSCQRMSLFKLSAHILLTNQAQYIRKYNAQVIYINKDVLIIQKTGYDEEIREMYNQLEGEDLLGYYQNGLLVFSPAIANFDILKAV